MLSDFIGNADISPFRAIVENCPTTVFEADIMKFAVQYKWDHNVWPRKRKELCIYTIPLVVDTLATACTRLERTAATEALQWAMLAVESLSLCHMAYKLVSPTGGSRWQRIGASRLCASVTCWDISPAQMQRAHTSVRACTHTGCV